MVGPLPDSWFSPRAGREAEVGAISLEASEGEHWLGAGRSRLGARPVFLQGPPHLTTCFLGDLCGVGLGWGALLLS